MNLFSIGGSDPSSGAGIQSDVKSFHEFGVYGLTVITAITGQNTSNFGMIEAVSKKILKNSLKSFMSTGSDRTNWVNFYGLASVKIFVFLAG